ncbi:MAG: ABC transporter substrate-binding protein [Candidatus Dormiibacterota bacterium]
MTESSEDLSLVVELMRRGLSRRGFLRGAAAVVAAGGTSSVLLEACGGTSPSTSSSGGAPKRGGHITEGWNTDIKTFNSILTQDVYSNLVINLVSDGLLSVDGKGNLIPSIASAVPGGGSDGNTYTFKLRSDVKWTDGMPVTSDDVLFTYNLIFAPEYAAVASPRRGDFTKHVDSISAPDPQTFVIKTKAPYAPLLVNHGTYGIMPKHVLSSVSPVAINTMSYNSAPTVTNGMFKFVSWQQGAQVVLARNDGYYRGAPLLDKYVYKVLPSQVAIGNALKTGEIDVGSQLDPSQISSLQTVQGLTIDDFVTPSFQFLAYNLDPAKPAGKILQDQAVRQALYYAINRPAIVKSVLYDQGSVANSVEPPTVFAYNPNTTPAYDYSPSKANQLLDKAGWVKGSNGVRAKDGVQLAFTMQAESGNLTLTNVMQVIQQNWKAVGCNMTPTTIQFPQLVTNLTDTRDFDIILVGFNFVNDPDQAQLFSSSGTAVGGFNGMDFKNGQVDNLLAEGAATLDKAKRKQIYDQYQNLMAQLAPVVLLYFSKQAYGHISRVQGTQLNTFQQYTRPWMNKVSVTDGK